MKVGGRKERIVVSQDEIAMRIQRKMEYVGNCEQIIQTDCLREIVKKKGSEGVFFK